MGSIWLALAFGLFGAVTLGLGLFSFFRDRRLLPHFSEVGEGIVSGFTEPDEEGFVRPCVEFVHSKGTVTITGNVGSNPPGYKIGQKVPVRYPPGKPRLAILADFRQLYLFEVASIGFGVAGLGAA